MEGNCYTTDSGDVEKAPLNTRNGNLAQGIATESISLLGDIGLTLLVMCCFQCEVQK